MSEEIDWNQQWSSHAHSFYDGKAHIPLPQTGEFLLEPGPGFGDFSHPTTHLTMELMLPLVKGKDVFDIGCGSGILSVAAALRGARSVSICDIDPKAITHAKLNGSLNGVEFGIGKPLSSQPLVLMNMISSEQVNAWSHNHTSFSRLITSGVLESERDRYLTFAHQQGWAHEQELEKEGWLAFVFKEISS